ncbi:MAG: 1-acyl-sn-glycerol-3-phosphate acyltransferase [Gammaproteobacteria bacterium]|nr:1-acyl-sn-glycerol-3-phosphate acyltransferase [Gammaproteobacteria bacterium]
MYPLRISLAFILLALMALVLTPIAIFRPMHRNNMADISRICGRFMLWYWGADIKIEHEERLQPDQPCVMIANHQDTQDIFFAISIIRNGTVTLGKWEMIYIPFIGWLYYLAGNILIKRSNKEKAQKALSLAGKKMKKNRLSVLIFPEGTRNWGEPLPFKLGAFKLAIEAQVPIQPICFSLRHITMDYKKWCTGTVKVKCLEPISTQGMTQEDAVELAVHCRKLIEQECIEISK